MNPLEKLGKGAILQAYILRLLQDKPLHGYALMATLNKVLRGRLSASVVYPLLAKIEKDGLISSAWTIGDGRPRKVYTLTPRGNNALNAEVLELKMVMAPLLTVGAA